MGSVKIESHHNVALLRLDLGVTNALNLDFLKDISMSLQKLKKDESVDGIVIASGTHKFFSIGFDIPQLNELSRNELKLFYQTFNRLCLYLYTIPKPTIAAITGHAIAGGCILALCCDYRYISDGRKLMGLNEIKLGLPVPYPASCILKQIVGGRIARELMESGDFHQPPKLFSIGLIDQVLPLNNVIPKAIERVKLLGAMPNKAYSMIKRNRTEQVEKEIQEHLDEREKYFLEAWSSEEAQELLKEAIKKF